MNKRGDTIIEVMIAIVVLGAALGAAFAITNSSTRRTFNNSERYQALQYANRQIELIRIGSNQESPEPVINYSTASGTSCFVMDGGGVVKYSTSPGTECLIDDVFTITVSEETAYTNDSFQINVTWPQLGGGTGEVELHYAIE